MSYEEAVEHVVQVVEAVGAAIMVLGGLWVLVAYAVGMLKREKHDDAYAVLRRRLGQVILLGLEVLIVGDIVRTIVVDPTVESVAVLGLIVIIRIVLSFSLEVEMDGAWPWNRWKVDGGGSSR